MRFQQHYQRSAKPFEWTFTRSDLDALLEKLKQKSRRLARTAPTAVVAVLLATARVRTSPALELDRRGRADFESSEAGRVMGKDRHQRQRDGL
jgi:hypothetical protein